MVRDVCATGSVSTSLTVEVGSELCPSCFLLQLLCLFGCGGKAVSGYNTAGLLSVGAAGYMVFLCNCTLPFATR